MAKTGKKGKDKKDGSKDKKDGSKAKLQGKASAAKLVPVKPKVDPCLIECPIYYLFDIPKPRLNPFFEPCIGPENGYVYLKKDTLVHKLFSELKGQHEEEQQNHDAVINEIIDLYADLT